MATPDPEGFSLLAKVVAAGTAILAPVGWFWTRLDKKADKQTVNKQFEAVANELATQRGHIAHIFDQMREDRSAAEERHREVLMHLLEAKK